MSSEDDGVFISLWLIFFELKTFIPNDFVALDVHICYWENIKYISDVEREKHFNRNLIANYLINLSTVDIMKSYSKERLETRREDSKQRTVSRSTH